MPICPKLASPQLLFYFRVPLKNVDRTARNTRFAVLRQEKRLRSYQRANRRRNPGGRKAGWNGVREWTGTGWSRLEGISEDWAGKRLPRG